MGKERQGRGEEKDKASVGPEQLSHTRSPEYLKGFREWWDVHVLFQELLGRKWGWGGGTRQQSLKRSVGGFLWSPVPLNPRRSGDVPNKPSNKKH